MFAKIILILAKLFILVENQIFDAENCKTRAIYRRNWDAYEEAYFSYFFFYKWFKLFKANRNSIQNEDRIGMSTVASTPEMVNTVNGTAHKIVYVDFAFLRSVVVDF